VARPSHPNKEIEAAVLTLRSKGGHGSRSRDTRGENCFVPIMTAKDVWSTPRNPQNHAKQLRREIDRCPHKHEQKDNENV
jgi:hypothetical protein